MKCKFPLIFFATSCLIQTVSLGQSPATEVLLENSIQWTEGSIMLNDGTELKGVLKYNDNIGILSYENGDNSRSFTAKNVVGFEFFDDAQQKQRVFYSLPFQDPVTGTDKNYFFEALREYNSFALLSRIQPMVVKQRVNSSPYMGVGVNTMIVATELSQLETIYIMSPNGEIKAYLEIVEKEVDGWLSDTHKTKNKVVDKDLLKQYTGKYHESLEAFAHDNKLSFKRKTDLLKIMDHYKDLIDK